MRYYTYKVTFSDLPGYFYYGYHSSKRGTRYSGSPKTWKHLWKFFEPEVQVLQWYETKEEAVEAEKSILRATWKDPYSLNENVGGVPSLESMKKGGVKSGVMKTELQTLSRKRSGKALASKRTKESLISQGRKAGKMRTPSQQKARSLWGEKGKSNFKWGLNNRPVLCLETGFIYPSINKAMGDTGIHQSNISKCCRGLRKTAGGFHWSYF